MVAQDALGPAASGRRSTVVGRVVVTSQSISSARSSSTAARSCGSRARFSCSQRVGLQVVQLGEAALLPLGAEAGEHFGRVVHVAVAALRTLTRGR